MRARTLTFRRTALALACLGWQGIAAEPNAGRSSRATETNRAGAATTGPTQLNATPAPRVVPPQQGAADVDVDVAPLTAAQQDFLAMKAARDAAVLPGRALPVIAAPELPNSDPVPPATNPRVVRPPLRDAPSPNWLVDAVQKRANADPRNGTVADGLRSRNPSTPTPFSRSSDPRDSAADTRSVNAESASARSSRSLMVAPLAAEKNNPLTPFLADWMTPQDYSLLQPGPLGRSGEGRASNDAYGALMNPTLPATASAPMSADATSRSLGGSAANSVSNFSGGAANLPRENPYLKALEAASGPSSSAGRVQPSTPPPTVSLAPSLASGPAPMPPASTPPSAPLSPRVPDFVKPSTDDRYFKPLKRF